MRPKGGDVYVNVPHSGIGNDKDSYCPLCYYELLDIKMVWDPKLEFWKCPKCGYDVPRHQNPVENSDFIAGNEQSTQTPYMRSVSFTRKAIRPSSSNIIYRNPISAWQDDKQ